MNRSQKVKAGALLVALVGTLSVVDVGKADYAPSGTDVVGVGAETLNFLMDFSADGDPNGNLGYNAANNANKLVVFDSTGDANARNSYANGSTLASPIPLNPTVVLRAGTTPVQRPTTSGSSFSAFLADTGTVHKIDFIKTIAKPTAAQQATAAANGWGFLHVVQIGSDPLQVVAATVTNVPAGGLSAAELIDIYKCTKTHWNELPGNAGGSTDTIVPLITPVGAGTRNTFLADLKAANGGVTVTLGGCVQLTEPNDPTGITGLNSTLKPNAIMPMAVGRLNLWNSGYFHDPNVPFPGGPSLAPGIAPLTGTATDGNAAYSSTVGLYVIFRQSDAALGPWQPGSTKNWVQTLFSDPSGTPFFKRASTQALIAAAGVTPTYNDLGNVSAG